MKRYDVQITAKAESDLEGIYQHIANVLLAPVAAMNQYNRIADAILTLEEMPERIKTLDSEPERSQGVRRLLVDNYSVFFIIQDSAVTVFRVLYSASDIPRRLLEEL